MIGSNNSASESGAKKERWSRRKRLIIYSAAAAAAVFIGIVAAVGNTIYQLYVMMPHLLEVGRFELEERVSDSKDPRALKVLFVGNSLVYVKSLPRQFAYLCSMTNRPLKLYQVVEPNQTLAGHFARGRVARLLSSCGPWDYVILHDKSSAPFLAKASMEKFVGYFVEEVRKYGAKPVLLMTWGDKGFVPLQDKVSQEYISLGRRLNTPVIPDGDAWFIVQRKYPGIELYADDRHHPGCKGSYLGALLTFCMLTGSSPEALPPVTSIPSNIKEYGPLCELSESDRKAFIEVVRECLDKNDSFQSEHVSK